MNFFSHKPKFLSCAGRWVFLLAGVILMRREAYAQVRSVQTCRYSLEVPRDLNLRHQDKPDVFRSLYILSPSHKAYAINEGDYLMKIDFMEVNSSSYNKTTEYLKEEKRNRTQYYYKIKSDKIHWPDTSEKKTISWIKEENGVAAVFTVPLSSLPPQTISSLKQIIQSVRLHPEGYWKLTDEQADSLAITEMLEAEGKMEKAHLHLERWRAKVPGATQHPCLWMKEEWLQQQANFQEGMMNLTKGDSCLAAGDTICAVIHYQISFIDWDAVGGKPAWERHKEMWWKLSESFSPEILESLFCNEVWAQSWMEERAKHLIGKKLLEQGRVEEAWKFFFEHLEIPVPETEMEKIKMVEEEVRKRAY